MTQVSLTFIVIFVVLIVAIFSTVALRELTTDYTRLTCFKRPTEFSKLWSTNQIALALI